MRTDGRANDQLRPVKVTRGFTQTPAGSVLWQQGKHDRAGDGVGDAGIAALLQGEQGRRMGDGGIRDAAGINAAAQGMAKDRAYRFARDGDPAPDRALTAGGARPFKDRAAHDRAGLPGAAGGWRHTETACISAAWVALKDAVARLPREMPGAMSKEQGAVPARYDSTYYDPNGAVVDQLAAVSVGVIDGRCGWIWIITMIRGRASI